MRDNSFAGMASHFPGELPPMRDTAPVQSSDAPAPTTKGASQ